MLLKDARMLKESGKELLSRRLRKVSKRKKQLKWVLKTNKVPLWRYVD